MGDNPTSRTGAGTVPPGLRLPYGAPVPETTAATTSRRPSTWAALGHVVLDIVFGTVSFTVVVTLLATTGALLITFPLALPSAWLLFVLSRGFAHLHRSRLRALGVDLADPVPPFAPGRWWSRLRQRARSVARWKEVAHAVVALPVGLLAGVATLVVWSTSAALVALPLYVGGLPEDTARFWLFDITQGPGSVAAAAAGLLGLLLLGPLTTRAMAGLDVAVSRALLGPSRKAALAADLARAETGRVAAVDTAETERRRIERDLHDGAQQRLVALAMDLGAARERLATDPEGGARLVAQAHDEAKAALKEIRDLVRGIHPVILEDRGLDAALSAVVARCPVPVALRVDLDPDDPRGRPPAAVESAAYFVGREALTNVARHSGAARAWVDIARTGTDRLVVEVRDDGRGGADTDNGGTGLRGLRDRVTGLGGTLDVISPPGGPTTLLVELPCAS